MIIKAYVQTEEGKELELEVTQPTPSEMQVDKCIMFTAEALQLLAQYGAWMRVVSQEEV